MCDEWRKDFSAFLRDVGPRPSMKHSLDRFPNNDGHYEPGNVRWATRAEQQTNRSLTRRITLGDTTLTITEWSARTGIPLSTLQNRLGPLGWSVELALHT